MNDTGAYVCLKACKTLGDGWWKWGLEFGWRIGYDIYSICGGRAGMVDFRNRWESVLIFRWCWRARQQSIRSAKKPFILLIALPLLLAGCQTNNERPASFSTHALPPVDLHIAGERLFENPAPLEFKTFPGLKSIDELVPELELQRLGSGSMCGLIIPEELNEKPVFVSFNPIGYTERWVPLDGEVKRTLYFEFAPKDGFGN